MSKIINGIPVDIKSYLWMSVLLFQNMDTQILCGSSYLGYINNNHWLLSAAHCEFSNKIDFISRKACFNVDSMSNLLTDSSNFDCFNIIDHYLYKDIFYPFHNDIVLYKLENAIEIDNIPSFTFLTEKEFFDRYDNQLVDILGYGITENGYLSETIRKGSVSIQSQNSSIYLDMDRSKESSFLAINYQNLYNASDNIDTCNGDSGGPVYDSIRNEIIGITSYGKGCALDGFPGVYTRVSYYVNWINSIIKGD